MKTSGDTRSYKQARKSAWGAPSRPEDTSSLGQTAHNRVEQENDSPFQWNTNEADFQSTPYGSRDRYYDPCAARPKAAGRSPVHKGSAFMQTRPDTDTANVWEEKSSESKGYELDGIEELLARLSPLKISQDSCTQIIPVPTNGRFQVQPLGEHEAFERDLDAAISDLS